MRGVFSLSCLSLFVASLSTLAFAQSDSNGTRKVSDVTAEEDPYLWLEDVGGDKALAWVREQNAVTQDKYEKTEEFTNLRDDLLKILDSDERIRTLPPTRPSGGYSIGNPFN